MRAVGSTEPMSGVETGQLPPAGVQRMFDRIAPVYDFMNYVMTAGLDRHWRRITVEQAVRPGDRGGAGEVVGLDFSEQMLERARRKAPEIRWVQGDALALPFGDESFDAVTVGFGVRNVDDLEAAIRELRRVVRLGGTVAILELTPPAGALAPFYRFWFDGVIPLLGMMLPGGSAYTYLPASVRRFPLPEALADLLAANGFADVRFRRFAGSVVALHVGRVLVR